MKMKKIIVQIVVAIFFCGTVIAQPKIIAAEYFWGTVDPGNGNGIALSAEDGTFNEAVETVIKNIASLPSYFGAVLFNIRVKDSNNNWGPLFKKTIFVYNTSSSTSPPINITYTEYFFGIFDPGEGAGTPIVAFDGAYDEAVETVLRTSATWTMSSGPTLFNIRCKDSGNNWGPLFKKTVFPYGANPTANLLAEGDTIVVCPNSNVALNYNGPNGYHINWFNGDTTIAVNFIASLQGYYSVTSVLGSSSYSDSIYVKFKPATIATVSPAGTILVCGSSSISLTANTGVGLTYQWYYNGSLISSETSQNYLPTLMGNYYVAVKNAATGCTSSSSSTTLATTIAISPSGSVSSCTGSLLLTAPLGTGNTYQWQLNSSNIPSATGNTYTATVNGNYRVIITNGLCIYTTSATAVTINSSLLATITPSGPTTFCQGNNVVLNANAGSGYTYQWSQNGTNIVAATGVSYTASAAGNYSVEITNSGSCSSSASITIAVNALPSVTASSTPSPATVCAGSSVTLTGSGTTSYAWSGGISNGTSFIPASTLTYTVTGTDANGCVNTATRLVTVNALPSVTASSSPSPAIVCAGSSVILTGSGATSYAWSGGISNGTSFIPASTLTYTVTGTDANGCVNTATRLVTVNALPSVTASSSPSPATVCAGSSVTLTGSGATSYAWSGGISNGTSFIPASTLNYTVTGTDANGCVNTATQLVSVNSLPNVVLILNADTVCLSTPPFILSGGTPIGGTYTGTSVTLGSFNSSTSGLGLQLITYSYTDGNSCTNTNSDQIFVDLCTGINKFKNNTSFTVYPNPVSDEIIIEFQGNKNNTGFEIVNPIGQVIFKGNLLEKTIVQTSNFAPGVYLIKLKNGKSYEFKKIVKE